jgi:hypothetical protein
VLPDERHHVPAAFDEARAEEKIRAAICDGTFRPLDAARAMTLDELHALYVPFWRLDLQRNEETLRISGSLRLGNVALPIPTQHARESRATWMVCARGVFPYTMKKPGTLLPGDAKPLVVDLADLVRGDPDLSKGRWQALDADIDHEKAQALASSALRGSGSGEVVTEVELTAFSKHFVRYPIWYARYSYKGERYFAGISGVSGVCVTAKHPSKLRAGVEKLGGIFTGETFRKREAPRPPAAEVTPHTPAAKERPEAAAPSAAGTGDLAARFKAHVARERRKR